MVGVHEFHPVEGIGIARFRGLEVSLGEDRAHGAVVVVKTVEVEESGFVVFCRPSAESCGVSGALVGYGGRRSTENFAPVKRIERPVKGSFSLRRVREPAGWEIGIDDCKKKVSSRRRVASFRFLKAEAGFRLIEVSGSFLQAMMEGPFVMSTGLAVGLKRKSMSLNGDVLKATHDGLVDVNPFSRDAYSREERRELRKKLRLHLEQVQGVASKILARQEELTKVPCVVYPESQLSRTQNGGPLQKEIKLVPATMLDEPHRVQNQRESRLARQPSVVVTSDVMVGAPDASGRDKRMPKANQMYINSEFVSGKDKMPVTEKSKSKPGGGSKRLGSVKVEACDSKKQKTEIIKKRKPTLSHNDDEIEIDIDSLDNDTLWELDRFVSNCMKSRGKLKKAGMNKLGSAPTSVPGSRSEKPVPIVEIITENPPIASNAEGRDEDVTDAPIVADPAGAIHEKEKESAEAGPMASSSSGGSTSDSGSGSSSSDPDSASSSGSDCEADDAPRPPSAPKDGEATRNVAEAQEEPVLAKLPLASQQDSRDSQESQMERQLSPEKLLRAALLRGRFADTILKAQEKTLTQNKNEKLDPEKVKRDREELEKRQKEEKARLHAEAKAAEAARRKAEVEAAHEAKRKREAEREAARRQLQQMEKTVEIDENSEILKDLEMLRTASMDHLPSSGEDSPDSDSPDGLPDFALQGGNPLERLGLFMKNDEDDEDEEEHVAAERNTSRGGADCVGDVEEGEID
ncbi:hypothetical protein R1flu_022077 [Riccia fluitans]|uniref:NET domain-containing protein n=1 Tax=Riccia fluitans TaxID=41844 RepID=A0ABD1ZU45_9MARC